MSKTAILYRMITDTHRCPYGIKSKAILSSHGYTVDDRHLKTRQEATAFKEAHGVTTTPQIFIDGTRIGGYEALRDYFNIKPQHDTQPLVAIFGTTGLMALAVSWAITKTVVPGLTLTMFIALSMCVLAIQKLRDLESFSTQFITYDLLAMRWVRYAYIYPFVEMVAGVGMIAGVYLPIVASGALFISTIGSISVFKAVYIEKRDLKCACVGGNSTVSLGFISLTENLMMMGMALWLFFFGL